MSRDATTRAQWGVVIALIAVGLFVVGVGTGNWATRHLRDQWWLDRITGKDNAVPGSAVQRNIFTTVYCVAVDGTEAGGFKITPVPCVDPPEMPPPMVRAEGISASVCSGHFCVAYDPADCNPWKNEISVCKNVRIAWNR